MNSILKWSNLRLAILSGLLTGIAYPPLNLGFLAWFSLVPLIHIWLHSSPGKSAKYTFIASLISNVISVYWIALNSGTNIYVASLSMFGAIFYLTIWWAGFGYIFSKINPRIKYGILLIPFLWVIMEWVRSFGPLGFPWLNIALTQTMFLPLIQTAELFGTYGIGLWIVTVNIGFYTIVKTNWKQLRPILFTASLIMLSWFYGETRIRMVEKLPVKKTMSIAVTQPNINPTEKWNPESRSAVYETMYSLLDSALADRPDLVLWPESALPSNLRLSNGTRNFILNKLKAGNGKLLSGTPDYERMEDGSIQYFNATIFLSPGEKIKMYRKIRLVPFAEYIPLSPIYPGLSKLNFGQANFIQGNEFTRFVVDSTIISNVICYESSYPELIAEFCKRGAEIITIQANDGWLGKSSGPYQHFELARLRAVENRVSVVRSANTGISGAILPSGKVIYKAELDKQELFIVSVPALSTLSLYSILPELLPLSAIFITICIIWVSWRRKNI